MTHKVSKVSVDIQQMYILTAPSQHQSNINQTLALTLNPNHFLFVPQQGVNRCRLLVDYLWWPKKTGCRLLVDYLGWPLKTGFMCLGILSLSGWFIYHVSTCGSLLLGCYCQTSGVRPPPETSLLRRCACHTWGWSPCLSPAPGRPGWWTPPWCGPSTAGRSPGAWWGCSGRHSGPCSAEPVERKWTRSFCLRSTKTMDDETSTLLQLKRKCLPDEVKQVSWLITRLNATKSWGPDHEGSFSDLYAIRVVVQQQHTQAGHLLGLYHGLQVSQEVHVFRHISG